MIRRVSGYPLLVAVFFGLAALAILTGPHNAFSYVLAGYAVVLGLLCVAEWRRTR